VTSKSPITLEFGPAKPKAKTFSVDVLGGKGAHLCEMAVLGLPVPPGIIIPTGMHKAKDPEAAMNAALVEVHEWVARATEHYGYQPLLSVRSGAPVSMPGMMDTVLNVGMSASKLGAWSERLSEGAAKDCLKRFVTMYRDVVGVTPPSTAGAQLTNCIRAVFDSWNSERAVAYRDLSDIPHDMGTACVIQVMVFGNLNDDSGSGVLFTRNPQTGEDDLMGEFLPNAQGEDVVNGSRTPLPLTQMKSRWPDLFEQLHGITVMLEGYYGDMQDIEFTVQDGELFILQTRTGKRSAQAAFRIAVDMAEAGDITRKMAMDRVTGHQWLALQRPRVADGFDHAPVATGLAASPGVVTGVIATTVEAALAADAPVILVRPETTPNDIKGMIASVGVLTATGGATSHAAVVARGMDKTCVVGVTDMKVCPNGVLEFGTSSGVMVAPGSKISICGSTGRVWVGEVPVTEPEGLSGPSRTMLTWVMEAAGTMLAADRAGSSVKRVVGTSWLGGDVRARLKELSDAGCEGVVLDLTPPHDAGDEHDAAIYAMFGLGWRFEQYKRIIEVIEALLSHPDRYEGLSVILPDGFAWVADKLGGSGIGVVKNAKTLADLIGAGGTVTLTKDFVEHTLGGQAVLDALRGKFDINTMPPAVSAPSAMFAKDKS